MRIQSNIVAMNALRHLNINVGKAATLTERLSSGFRINRAADDPAGLYMSEKMRAQIRGLSMAKRNALDSISLIQTAEGGLQIAHDILQRIRELAVQFGNETNAEEDMAAIRHEIDQLIQELNRIAHTTEFNTKPLLDGSMAHSSFGIRGITADTLGLTGLTDLLETFDNAAGREAIRRVEAALSMVSGQRSQLGAMQNRLEFTIQNLEISIENLQAAESRIRDVDMAKAMVEFVKTQILIQAAAAMLAHANQRPHIILQLLR